MFFSLPMPFFVNLCSSSSSLSCSVNKYFLNTSCGPGTVLGMGETGGRQDLSSRSSEEKEKTSKKKNKYINQLFISDDENARRKWNRVMGDCSQGNSLWGGNIWAETWMTKRNQPFKDEFPRKWPSLNVRMNSTHSRAWRRPGTQWGRILF